MHSAGRIQVIRDRAGVEALIPAWRRLHAAGADRNPFANPDFQVAWLAHQPHDLDLFVVCAIGQDGELDWLAPLHLAGVGPLGIGGRCLMSFSAHGEGWLVEVPPLPTRIEPTAAAQQLVNALLGLRPEWGWAELTLSSEHGWLATTDDSRFPRLGRRRILHKEVRASTYLDLGSDWERTRGALKRNLRNSLATAHRRADREYGGIRFVSASESAERTDAFVRRLVDLNLARAQAPGRAGHWTPFQEPRNVALFVDSATRVVDSKLGDVVELRAGDGRTLASTFTPFGAATTYLSLSGFEPDAWRISPTTLLAAEAARRAIDLGHDRLVFSPGPHVSKSRWSPELDYAQTFLIVGERRRDRLRFLGYWLTRAVTRFVDEGRLIRDRDR